MNEDLDNIYVEVDVGIEIEEVEPPKQHATSRAIQKLADTIEKKNFLDLIKKRNSSFHPYYIKTIETLADMNMLGLYEPEIVRGTDIGASSGVISGDFYWKNPNKKQEIIKGAKDSDYKRYVQDVLGIHPSEKPVSDGSGDK
jgi:hypothetical protein